MSGVSRFKRVLGDVTSVVVHFAHGGLLMAGVLVSIFAAAYLSGGLGALKIDALKGQPAESVVRIAADEQELMADASPNVRGITDYLARRYRVASVAVQPLVQAAHDAGLRFGLDPLLIVAVMAIESNFNPIAESPMGARGLMQVIPRFHPDKLGEAGEEALLDPVSNIQIGAQVLKESIRRAGNVEAGLQQYAGAPSDTESQYAAKVMAERQRLEQAARRAKQSAPKPTARV